jgi:hypothetical protein
MHPTLIHSSKLFVLALALVLPSILMAANDQTRIREETERIHRLDEALSRAGIAEMLEMASKEQIGAPMINSKYYAERISRQEPALAPLEQAKRHFGLNVAHAIEEVANEFRNKSTSEHGYERASDLLDLVRWLKSEKGYGNYCLVTRCENVAAVPLAYLTVDLAFPIAKITALRDRIMSRDDERAFRKTVLNTEAPTPFIGELTGSQSEQDEQMQIAWSKGWHAMAD